MAPAENPSRAPEPDPRELAELSALADGTLAVERRAAVEAHIASSPELTELYTRERRVARVLREDGARVRAPASLRARIEAERPARNVRRRRRVAYRGALAGALAVLVLGLVLVSPAGTPGAPSISQATGLALRGPSAPAPRPDPSAPDIKLARNIEDVYFPNWASQFGWTAVGQRVDHLTGRLALTVYYGSRGRRLAYTIVAAPALAQPKGLLTRLNGTELRTLRLDGRVVVTWHRAGHTCVLSAVGVPSARLLELAAWKARGLARG